MEPIRVIEKKIILALFNNKTCPLASFLNLESRVGNFQQFSNSVALDFDI